MQLFIDSANPEEIKTVWEWGIMDGVTTNPTLAAKTGKKYSEIVQEILGIIDSEATLSLEVVATDFDGMLQQARQLAAIDDRVVVKLPATADGIRATKVLASEGILVNVTLVFSPAQALLAAKAGAYYVSPFVGRLNDIEEEAGDEVVEKIRVMYDNYGFQTQILYASVRDVAHVEHAAMIGADIATCPFEVLQAMVKHQLTDKGVEKFLADWQESGLDINN